MNAATKQLVAIAKALAIPAGLVATLVLSFVFVTSHYTAHAAPMAGPLDSSSVEPLVALDNAVEAVAARVTPCVVNVAVTSRVSGDQAEDGQDGGQNGGQGFGGMNPQDLPPGFRQFFFGQNGQGMKPQPQIEHGMGSGVIISPDGYIVTNDHVVDGATQIRVTLNDRRVFTAKLVGVDKLNDLAVIKIDAHNLPSLAVGRLDKAAARADSAGLRQSLRQLPVHGNARHHQRPRPAQSVLRRCAQAGRLHPDRRGHQSRQLRRPAG